MKIGERNKIGADRDSQRDRSLREKSERGRKTEREGRERERREREERERERERENKWEEERPTGCKYIIFRKLEKETEYRDI